MMFPFYLSVLGRGQSSTSGGSGNFVFRYGTSTNYRYQLENPIVIIMLVENDSSTSEQDEVSMIAIIDSESAPTYLAGFLYNTSITNVTQTGFTITPNRNKIVYWNSIEISRDCFST